MKKAQSLIVQFILFFMIGFSLFLVIGNFFRYQSDIFRGDIADLSLKLTNSYLSFLVINSVDTCKQCDYVETSVKFENTTAGYFFDISFSSEGLRVSTFPKYSSFTSSIHNLNKSIRMQGEKFSVETLNLTFSRTKNELEVK